MILNPGLDRVALEPEANAEPVQEPFAYNDTVEPTSAVPIIKGVVLSFGDGGLVAVSVGVAGGCAGPEAEGSERGWVSLEAGTPDEGWLSVRPLGRRSDLASPILCLRAHDLRAWAHLARGLSVEGCSGDIPGAA